MLERLPHYLYNIMVLPYWQVGTVYDELYVYKMSQYHIMLKVLFLMVKNVWGVQPAIFDYSLFVMRD